MNYEKESESVYEDANSNIDPKYFEVSKPGKDYVENFENEINYNKDEIDKKKMLKTLKLMKIIIYMKILLKEKEKILFIVSLLHLLKKKELVKAVVKIMENVIFYKIC